MQMNLKLRKIHLNKNHDYFIENLGYKPYQFRLFYHQVHIK